MSHTHSTGLVGKLIYVKIKNGEPYHGKNESEKQTQGVCERGGKKM